jgi:hypothetical protein
MLGPRKEIYFSYLFHLSRAFIPRPPFLHVAFLGRLALLTEPRPQYAERLSNRQHLLSEKTLNQTSVKT